MYIAGVFSGEVEFFSFVSRLPESLDDDQLQFGDTTGESRLAAPESDCISAYVPASFVREYVDPSDYSTTGRPMDRSD